MCSLARVPPRASSGGPARPARRVNDPDGISPVGVLDCSNQSIHNYLSEIRRVVRALKVKQHEPPGQSRDISLEHVMTAISFAMQFDVQARLGPLQVLSAQAATRAYYSSLLTLENAEPRLIALLDAAMTVHPEVPGAATVALMQVRVRVTANGTSTRSIGAYQCLQWALSSPNQQRSCMRAQLLIPVVLLPPVVILPVVA
jgi:hypothetical protein